MLVEYGFQPTTALHCRPLKYRVSLRGSTSSGAGVGGATSTVSITVWIWVSLTTCVWTTGTSTVWMTVSGVGVAQEASAIPSTITTEITRYKRFIIILLRVLFEK